MMMRIQLSSVYLKVSAPIRQPSTPAGTMMRSTLRSQRHRYARMPKMSMMHRTTSMMTAAWPGAMTSAMRGVAVAPAPPRPPFESPVRTAAGMATAQNQGSAMRCSLVRLDVRPPDELGVLRQLLGDHGLELLDRHRNRVAAQLADLLAYLG